MDFIIYSTMRSGVRVEKKKNCFFPCSYAQVRPEERGVSPPSPFPSTVHTIDVSIRLMIGRAREMKYYITRGAQDGLRQDGGRGRGGGGRKRIDKTMIGDVRT